MALKSYPTWFENFSELNHKIFPRVTLGETTSNKCSDFLHQFEHAIDIKNSAIMTLYLYLAIFREISLIRSILHNLQFNWKGSYWNCINLIERIFPH